MAIITTKKKMKKIIIRLVLYVPLFVLFGGSLVVFIIMTPFWGANKAFEIVYMNKLFEFVNKIYLK